MPGWAKAGFDDSKWEAAIPAEKNGPVKAKFYEYQNPAPGGKVKIESREVDLGFKAPPKFEAFPGVPVRAIEEIKPIAVTSPTNGVYIFNLGQNFAGVVRLKVKGAAGTRDPPALRRDAPSRWALDDRESAQGARDGLLRPARRRGTARPTCRASRSTASSMSS